MLAYFGERIRWNHLAAFVCIIAAVAFTFLPAGSGQNVPPRAQAEAGANPGAAH